MHHIDRNAWWNEIWEAMDQLKSEGKILYVGSSNFAGWHIARANEIASKWHTVGLATEQSLYNLTERTIELEVIPAVQEYGMGLICLEPARGRLAGGGAQEGRRGSPLLRILQDEIDKDRDRLERYEKVCADLGARPADVALAWLLHQPAVTAPIIGPRTEEQLESSFRALEVRAGRGRPPQARRDLPGPGRRRARGLRLVARPEGALDLGGCLHDRGRVALRAELPEA